MAHTARADELGRAALFRGERRRLFVHVGCHAEIDAAGTCPRCGTRPGPAELEIRPGPALRHCRDDAVSRVLREPHRMLTPLPG